MSAPYTSAPFRVTGAVIPAVKPPQPPLAIPMRLDICDMEANHKKQFTLFILSWREIMKPDFQPRAASFREIGGIHGMPYVPWLGDPDEGRQTVRGSWLGYCNHGSILFPNWHRPYVMLIEQIMCDVARGIASKFASKQQGCGGASEEWMKAAAELRFPFWDWTHPRTGEEGIPDFFTTETIELVVPPGEPLTYENPLSHYRLNPIVDGFNNRDFTNPVYHKPGVAYFREWTRTYRHPQSQVVNVTDDYAKIDAVLTSPEPGRRGTWANLTNDVSGMFNFPLNIPPDRRANAWDEFSNTTFQSGQQEDAYKWNATPIEQSHNTVHLVVGGFGHMADNDTAGFDPIFFLHHCNVDRLLAFWEHIYPDYVAGTEGYLNPDGTRSNFTQTGGTWIETETQNLTDISTLPPFRNSGYNYWNPQDTHSLMFDPYSDSAVNKYYTYPPIKYTDRLGLEHVIRIDTDPNHPTGIQTRRMQRRYLQSFFKYDPRRERDEYDRLVTDIFKKRAPYSGEETRAPGRIYVEDYRQFYVSVSLDPTLCQGSYTLVISVKISGGERGEDKPYGEIGRVAVLSRGSSERCGNCQAQRKGGVRVHGIVTVPHHAVVEILKAAGRNEQNTRNEQVVDAISLGLEAAVVYPDGTYHSRLRGDPPPEETGRSLSHDAAPHLELLSSDVYQQFDEDIEGRAEDAPYEDVPYDFDDWKTHTTLSTFGRGWVLSSHDDA